MTAQQRKSEALTKLANLETEYGQYLAMLANSDARKARYSEDIQEQLAKILRITDDAIRDWLNQIDEDTRKAWNKRIFEMWLVCQRYDAPAVPAGPHRETALHSGQTLASMPAAGKRAATRRRI